MYQIIESVNSLQLEVNFLYWKSWCIHDEAVTKYIKALSLTGLTRDQGATTDDDARYMGGWSSIDLR